MKYYEIEAAFEIVSDSGGVADNSAYVSKTTGKIVYDLDDGFSEEECPEWVYEDDDYVQVPDKYDLDLGKQLVWDFVRQEIPGLEPKVRSIFSRSGAYSRYKDFLVYNDLLETWYGFSNRRTKEALLEWCSRNGIKVED